MHALFRRADETLSKMMDALAGLLLVHLRSAAATFLTSGDLINPHYCGTESRDAVQMIFEIFPYRTHFPRCTWKIRATTSRSGATGEQPLWRVKRSAVRRLQTLELIIWTGTGCSS